MALNGRALSVLFLFKTTRESGKRNSDEKLAIARLTCKLLKKT